MARDNLGYLASYPPGSVSFDTALCIASLAGYVGNPARYRRGLCGRAGGLCGDAPRRPFGRPMDVSLISINLKETGTGGWLRHTTWHTPLLPASQDWRKPYELVA